MSELVFTGERQPFSSNEFVSTLRTASEVLASSPDAQAQTVLFPTWMLPDESEFGEGAVNESLQMQKIRRAAKAIYSRVTETDEDGEYVSKEDIAALLHYIADMLEE